MYASLRPMRSPVLPPMRMNAAETSASSAIAPCTPLAVVSRSSTTAEIETFISDVSNTSTNIAIASRRARRPLNFVSAPGASAMVHPTTPLLPASSRGPMPRGTGGAGDCEDVGMGLPWDFRPIEGPRVTLALLRPDDLEALYTIQSDPEVCRYLLYEPRSRERVAEVLERDAGAMRLAEAGDFVQPAIREDSGRLIGTMYFKLASLDDKTAEIGWLLDPRYQGHGYAAESSALLLDLAFGRTRAAPRLRRAGSAERGIRRPLPSPRHASRGAFPRAHVVQGRLGGHGHLRDPRARVARRRDVTRPLGPQWHRSGLPFPETATGTRVRRTASSSRRDPSMVGMRTRIAAVVTAAVLAIGGASAATAAPPDKPGGPRYTAGAEGAGDAYFPYAGNGGYDVAALRPRRHLHAAGARAGAARGAARRASPRSTWSRRRTSTGSTSTSAAWTCSR